MNGAGTGLNEEQSPLMRGFSSSQRARVISNTNYPNETYPNETYPNETYPNETYPGKNSVARPTGWIGRFPIRFGSSSAGIALDRKESIISNGEIITNLNDEDASTSTPIASTPVATPNNLTNVSIMFIRHSESCANLLKAIGRKTDQVSYLDPELTRRGRLMATQRGSTINSMVAETLGTTIANVYIGASILRRTQQTARSILTGAGLPDKTIYVLPYISEVGLGYDNKPDVAEKRELQMDFRPFDDEKLEGRPADVPNVDGFFKWLGAELHKTGTFLRPTGSYIGDVRMIIVSHNGWMKELATSLKIKNPNYNNLDALAVRILYNGDGNIIGQKEVLAARIPYDGDAKLDAVCSDECVRHGARFKPICSGQGGTICERLRQLYEKALRGPVPWDDIRPIVQDLEVESKLQPAFATRAAVLRQYAPSTGFGRTRERRYLIGDLRGILSAWPCFNPPASGEACAAIDELLAVPEEAVNRIPNWQLSLAAEKIASAPNQKILWNYAKPAGWFTRKKGRKRSLRRNLQAIRNRAGCPPTGAPVEITPFGSPLPQNYTGAAARGGGVSRRRNRRSKKRLTHRK